MSSPRSLLVAGVLVLSAGLTGCVRRTITITSDPSGALVWLNDREIGRTPLDVDFVHYGTYDVRLTAPGYETLMTSGDAKPPWWDNVPLDLAAEVLPGESRAEIAWHYILEPLPEDVERAREDLRARAEAARATIPVPEADPEADQPGS